MSTFVEVVPGYVVCPDEVAAACVFDGDLELRLKGSSYSVKITSFESQEQAMQAMYKLLRPVRMHEEKSSAPVHKEKSFKARLVEAQEAKEITGIEFAKIAQEKVGEIRAICKVKVRKTGQEFSCCGKGTGFDSAKEDAATQVYLAMVDEGIIEARG